MAPIAVLDTNCFIYAANPPSELAADLNVVLSAERRGLIAIKVSRHTLDELSKKPDEAYRLAQTFEVLPYWPIRTIAGLVGTIEQLSGTWKDAHRNEDIQQEIEDLVKSGSSIRDRGAYLDALLAHADLFITNDTTHLANPAQRELILRKFGVRILTPCEFAQQLTDHGSPA